MPSKQFVYIILFWLCPMVTIIGQSQSVLVSACTDPIMIDGILDEPAWAEANIVSDFQMHFPFDSVKASLQTEVRVIYDESSLYISAVCYHAPQKDYVVQSLKRDFKFKENDAFAIYLNTFNDLTNGTYFAVNPYGVQSDGIIPDGGIKGVRRNWDGLWMAEVSHRSDRWIAEIRIPFKTLRYKDKNESWRVNFARNDRRQNEISTWTKVPRAFKTSVLSKTGVLHWQSPPKKPNSNISIVPYLSVGTYNDIESPVNSEKLRRAIGLDAKVALNTSMNLDVTINPDFSQVEVDQQVIDLQRFEIFFPEKRLLFLENSDLFSNIGNSRIRPFFSRRIGNADKVPIPILFGVRLSGNLDNNWRLGVMNMQTQADFEQGIRANNYTVANLQRRVFNSSNVSAFVINRQALREYYTFSNDFNRIAGVEYDLRSKDAKWNGKAFYHHAFTPGYMKNSDAYSVKLRYRTNAATLFFGADHAGENFITDVGFVPRLYHENENRDTVLRVGYTHFRANGHYRFFAKKNSIVDFWGPTFHADIYLNNETDTKERWNEFTFLIRLKNTSSLELKFLEGNPLLLYPFTLNGLNNPFRADVYPSKRMSLVFDTGKRNRFFGDFEVSYGDVYDGKQLGIKTEWTYRYKHFAFLSFIFDYEELSGFLPIYGEAAFTLLGSKLELSFNRNLFLTTFVQYNTQSDNFNVNSKLNWRFRPMSDLFLVYTENYTSQAFDVKNRALVLKLNYWIGGR